MVIGNLVNKVSSVRMHASGTPVKFGQNGDRVRLLGLPKQAPALVTTFALECDSEPRIDYEAKRATKPREGIYNARLNS